MLPTIEQLAHDVAVLRNRVFHLENEVRKQRDELDHVYITVEKLSKKVLKS